MEKIKRHKEALVKKRPSFINLEKSAAYYSRSPLQVIQVIARYQAQSLIRTSLDAITSVFIINAPVINNNDNNNKKKHCVLGSKQCCCINHGIKVQVKIVDNSIFLYKSQTFFSSLKPIVDLDNDMQNLINIQNLFTLLNKKKINSLFYFIKF